jgi:hypothetical protein
MKGCIILTTSSLSLRKIYVITSNQAVSKPGINILTLNIFFNFTFRFIFFSDFFLWIIPIMWYKTTNLQVAKFCIWRCKVNVTVPQNMLHVLNLIQNRKNVRTWQASSVFSCITNISNIFSLMIYKETLYSRIGLYIMYVPCIIYGNKFLSTKYCFTIYKTFINVSWTALNRGTTKWYSTPKAEALKVNIIYLFSI